MTVRDRHTILIIDQAKQACETYRKSLRGDQDCAYTILEEQSAAGALALCQSRSVDGILLNYRLPDGDGLQFLSMLKQQAGSTYPPIVIVAEQRDETIAVKAIKSGAEDYLVKQNLTPEALRFTMRTAIENARLRHQLQQSENRFHASVENMLDCYGIYSAIRNRSGKIVDFRVEYVNAAACNTNQLTKEQQIGKRLCQILPGHRESGLFEEYCQLVETGIPLVKESLVYSDQFGQHHLVKAFDIRATKLDDGFVATWRDVTEQVQVRLTQQQQLERERLVNQITQQIQQSLDLDMILQTTVTEVRRFLRSDRAFIYRFNSDFSGDIVVEAVGNGWNPILNQSVVDTYFVETKGEAYRQGRIQVVPDIYTAGLTDCHIKLLEQFQIRANVVVPILQGEFLWGLMTVSQCTDSRSWASEDVELLQHLAAHVGIAIQQSELYEQLRQKLVAHEQAETALSQSEAQFSTLVANIPGVVYRSLPGSGWPMIYISDGIEAITGYAAQDFAVHGTRTFASIIAPEDQEQVEDTVERAIQAKLSFELEYRLVHADGSYRWVYEKGQGIFDDSGTLLYLDGIIFDITDRKRIEAVLQAKERQFETLSEASPAAIFRFDAANNCVYMNRRWCEMTGSAAEAGLGLGWVETMHPDDRDSAAEKWLQWCQAAEPNVPFQNEARCLRPDGSIIWFFCQALPEIDEQGTLVGYVGALVDITDRKQAEDALRQSQETIQHQFMQIESIYQTAPIGLAILDPDLRFVRINQLLAKNNGISVEEHLGRTIDEVVPNLADKVEPLCRHLLETGEPILDMEISGETPAQPGVCRTWLESWFPLKQPDGTVVGINVVVQEITDRKRAQQQLEDQVVERTATLQQVVQELQSTLDALETSENMVRQQFSEIESIYATAPIGLCFIDRDLKFVRINQRMAEINGVSISKHIGRTLREILPDLSQKLEPLYQQVIQTGKPIHNFEISGMTPASPDTERDWLASFYPLKDTDGQVLGVNVVTQEITDRKQAEARLRYQAQIINQTHDSVISTDLDGYITSWNKGAERLFGYTESEALGKSVAILYPDDLQSVLTEQVVSPLRQKGDHDVEVSAQTKSGERVHVHLSLSLLRDFDQTPIGMIGYSMNITDRKQAENALRASEAQYRRIVETATEGIWQVDAEGNTTFVNQQMATMLGYNVSEMIGKPLFNFMDAEGRNIALHYWQQRQQGIHEQHDFKFRHRNGSDVWAIVSSSTIFDENGQMIGALGMLTNITERKQAEQKIREQAALLNITADAIIVRDLNHQILFWNAGAEHLFGWTAAEAIGQASTLLWRDASSHYVDVLKTVIEQGYWQGELQKITKENQEITVQSRWTLMRNDTGEPTSILTVDTDITEQKQLQAQFLRAQRLESIGTLASGIAHDLNNILTPILAVSQLLPHKLRDLSERDQNLLKIVADNSKRGSDLVKQILSFARGAEGQRVVVQVEHLLQEVSKIIQRTFPKSIELQNDIVTTPLWLVSADATQLHQVLMNLCVNARDAMPTGGILTLSAQNIQIDETYANLHPDAHPGTYLKITVADTGCGIPAEQLDRIFDPFFTTKETGKGTGLGLSTVLGIIKNHDGFVRVSSVLGEGTQFQVYLPTVSGMTVAQTEDENLPTGNQEVILIVDDEQPICDTIQALLEQHNYKTLIAHDGIEAIATYAQHRDSIDVVLMDTRMPLLDGLTAIRALQRMNSHLKIIAASGLDLNKQLNANDGNGSIAFLQKPYSMKELLNMISAVLRSP